MDYKKFNINSDFYVFITPKGWAHLLKKVGQPFIDSCITPRMEVIEMRALFRLQAHVVMDLFGECLDGIETNILIPIEKLI